MIKREDILNMLRHIDKLKTSSIYGHHDKAIYLCTDNYNEIAKHTNVQKSLIPASSGDGAIELASHGGEVFTYDINFTSYPAQQLKIAAQQKLEYREFVNFFFGALPLYEKYYWDLRDGLEPPCTVIF